MLTPEEIQQLSFEKAVKLEDLIEAIEVRIGTTSNQLTKTLLKEFLEKLSVQDGRVTSQLNKTTITLFNRAYNSYLKARQQQLLDAIVKDLNSIMANNYSYYQDTIPNFDLNREDVDAIVKRRLGIDSDGNLIKDGYMQNLANDAPVKSEIQRYVFKELFKGTGYEGFKKGLEEVIVGDEKKLGVFKQHYRTFSYDVYAQLSRYNSGLYAQKLGLTNFIYNGGLIKSSREFCIKKNGKVFTTEEAEQWVNDPTLTAIESKENYNWLLDFGGYNCRHSPDFIADEIAEVLRPDLRN